MKVPLGLLLAYALGVSVIAFATQRAERRPEAVVLREVGDGDRLVCAEYTSPSAPRQPNRSCQSVATVRRWLLDGECR